MFIINEETRNQLVSQSKRGKREKIDGKTRYEKRLKSRMSSSVREYNELDMNLLFKDNIININIPVRGETDNYIVKISYGGFLDVLRDQLKRNNTENIDLRIIIRSLIIAFNKGDVYISCSCLHPNTKIPLLDNSSPTVSELHQRYLNGEKLFVYSTDKNGDFRPGEVEKVWITKNTSNFIKITLDNNEEILTTPDHLYMLRDGSYCQAQDLKINQSLMPLYKKINKSGYEEIKSNTDNRYRSTYKEVAKYLYNDLILEANERANLDGSLDKMKYKVAIHHKDFNKLNNNPDNLQIMTALEHWLWHSKNLSLRWKTDPNFKKNIYKAFHSEDFSYKMRHRYDKYTPEQKTAMNLKNSKSNKGKHFIKKSEKTKQKISNSKKGKSLPHNKEWNSNISISIKNIYTNYTEDQWNIKKQIASNTFNNPEVVKKRKIGIKNYWNYLEGVDRENKLNQLRENSLKNPYIFGSRSNNTKEKMSISHIKSRDDLDKIRKKSLITRWSKRVNSLLSQGIAITEENFINSFDITNRSKIKKLLNDIFGDFNSFLDILDINNKYNHKIIKIDNIKLEETPVYDIKVKNYHNFAIDAGVILHNCPDFFYRFGYWATVKDINSGEPQLIPSDITNPKNDLGPGCKHVLLVLSNSSWLIKVASVIKNYIEYMSKHREKLYQTIIYPAIFNKKYEEPVQLDMFDDEEVDELETDKETIDTSNKEARAKGQFKPGNEYRFKKKDQLDDQISIDEVEVEDESESR